MIEDYNKIYNYIDGYLISNDSKYQHIQSSYFIYSLVNHLMKESILLSLGKEHSNLREI